MDDRPHSQISFINVICNQSRDSILYFKFLYNEPPIEMKLDLRINHPESADRAFVDLQCPKGQQVQNASRYGHPRDTQSHQST